MRALNIELGYTYLPLRIGVKGPLRVATRSATATATPAD